MREQAIDGQTDPFQAASVFKNGETQHGKVQLNFCYRADLIFQSARQDLALMGFC